MEILRNIEFVVAKSKYVSIDIDAMEPLLDKISKNILSSNSINTFKNKYFENKSSFAEALFIFACVNFCFWNKDDWKIKTTNGEFLSRTEAMEYCVYSWCNDGGNASEIIERLTYSKFVNDLQGGHGLQFLKERWQYLKFGQKILNEKYKGSFVYLVDASGNDAIRMLNILIIDFPFFNDVTLYRGRLISFHKKAQVLVSSINKLYAENKILNSDKLTSFSDYRLPQLLRYYGILVYNSELSDLVDNLMYVDKGSKQEVEIRASCLWAIELMKQILYMNYNVNIKSTEIDSLLWSYSRQIKNIKMHHRTPTTFY